jgi:hypothetical protein
VNANTIQAYERRNYGQTAIYATGPLAPHITALTGRKTLTETDIRTLRAMGFYFDMIPDPQGAASLIGGAL